MLLQRLLGYPISLMIMPSQAMFRSRDLARRFAPSNTNIGLTRKTIPSTSNATIELTEMSQRQALTQSIQNQKVIIYAVGNGDCYENHEAEYAYMAEKFPNTRIVGFNFRGVGSSTGTPRSENDWIDDALAVVKHYQELGIKPENILLNGHSLGGAILTLAAAKHYQLAVDDAKNKGQDPKKVKSLKLINNRSFANLTDEVVISFAPNSLIIGLIYGSLLALAFGMPMVGTMLLTGLVAFGSRFISESISQFLVKPIIKPLLLLTFGNMDAASAFKSLPKDCVDHIVAKNDGVIKDKAGLHHALRAENKQKKAALREIIQGKGNSAKKQRALDELLNIKDCKIKVNENPNDGMAAHNNPLEFLHTYHKARQNSNARELPPQLNGHDVMERKINRLFAKN